MSNNGQELPRGWALAKIGDLIGSQGLFLDGDWVESKDQDPNGDIRLIQLADVGDGAYLNKSSRFLTDKKAADLRCTFLERGDVLVARMPDPLGRACIFPGDQRKSVTVVDVCIVRCGKSGINHRWLMWTINSPKFRRDIASLQSGSTRKRISRGNLSSLTLPVPPLSEQANIVSEIEKQFTRLDAAVAALKRVQANLKRYRASVLKAACEGKLVPTEAELARAEGRDYESADKLLERILNERRAKWEADQLAKMKAQGKAPKDGKWKEKYIPPAAPNISNSPQLPEGWMQVSAEQITSIITDGEHITPQRSESGVLLLSARNVLDGKLSLRQVDYIPENEYERISKRLVIEAGDVLLSCSGTVGRSCVAPQGLRFSLVRSVAVLKTFFAMGKFLSIALRSIQLQSQISAKKTQTAQANIFQGKIKALIFPLPPLAEQQGIVAEVERRLSVIDEIESVVKANLKRAAALRQSILKRAFEGKLVPQDPADEPAAVLLERIRAERIETKAAKPARKKKPSSV